MPTVPGSLGFLGGARRRSGTGGGLMFNPSQVPIDRAPFPGEETGGPIFRRPPIGWGQGWDISIQGPPPGIGRGGIPWMGGTGIGGMIPGGGYTGGEPWNLGNLGRFGPFQPWTGFRQPQTPTPEQLDLLRHVPSQRQSQTIPTDSAILSPWRTRYHTGAMNG